MTLPRRVGGAFRDRRGIRQTPSISASDVGTNHRKKKGLLKTPGDEAGDQHSAILFARLYDAPSVCSGASSVQHFPTLLRR